MYFTTEPATLLNRPLFLGITNIIYKRQCINKAILFYLSRKVKLILHFKPILQADLKVYDALLWPLMYNINGFLIGLMESRFDPKYNLIAKSLLQPKNRQSYNIFLTLIHKNLCPSYVRWQIWQINYWLHVVGHQQVKTGLGGLYVI